MEDCLMLADVIGKCLIMLLLGIIIGNCISMGSKLNRMEKKIDRLIGECIEIDYSIMAKTEKSL